MEINGNLDMEIDCASIDGRIDVNQLSSTSRITVPKGVSIAVLTHGLRTRTIVGAGVRQDEDSPNIVELNGVESELIVEGR
ncbi:DNA-binding helix-turn-helix protein [Bifidobacterium pseudolongum subsp. pseudolongum]|nr:DNA-binding helix-turn-helix protein [Bifidobacterium pseudolongum subsp. pseudolongum]